MKNAGRCNSKGPDTNMALESGNRGEQKSLEERGIREKEWDGGKGGSGMGYTHMCQCTSEPTGVKHSRELRWYITVTRGSVRVVLTADSTAGTGEDCNN